MSGSEAWAAVVAATREGGRGGAWAGVGGTLVEAVEALRMGDEDSDTESSESMASLMREIGFGSDSEDSMGYDSHARMGPAAARASRRCLVREGAESMLGMMTGASSEEDEADGGAGAGAGRVS